jgi:hypothetical protein
MLNILNKSKDNVIQSTNLSVIADYSFALEYLVPLIDRLDFQRNPMRKSFYKRLEQDIINGCIMPSLTIAINKEFPSNSNDSFNIGETDLHNLLENAFVLDGIQRLSTLKNASSNDLFDASRPIFFNIIFCSSMDRLLYRMVTLNNGQKPMTARHQIEILASNMYNFDDLAVKPVAEKKAQNKGHIEGAFMSKENLIKGYLAFVSSAINIDNQKIIESKLDELITDQIMDSNITQRNIQYTDIISYINNLYSDDSLRVWFNLPNNLIGFSAAMAENYTAIKDLSTEEFKVSVGLIEDAFKGIETSKIKIGMARRKIVKHFFENYTKTSTMNINELLDEISMVV